MTLLEELESREELREFHLLPAARADLLRPLGRTGEAAEAYRWALTLATNDIERRFLRRRLAEIENLKDLRPGMKRAEQARPVRRKMKI